MFSTGGLETPLFFHVGVYVLPSYSTSFAQLNQGFPQDDDAKICTKVNVFWKLRPNPMADNRSAVLFNGHINY